MLRGTRSRSGVGGPAPVPDQGALVVAAPDETRSRGDGVDPEPPIKLEKIAALSQPRKAHPGEVAARPDENAAFAVGEQSVFAENVGRKLPVRRVRRRMVAAQHGLRRARSTHDPRRAATSRAPPEPGSGSRPSKRCARGPLRCERRAAPGPSWAIWLRHEKPLATTVRRTASRTARQEHALGAGPRDVVVRALVAPGAGHAAAAGVGRVDARAHAASSSSLLGLEGAGRAPVAVAVQEHAAARAQAAVSRSPPAEELGEVEGLPREPLRVLVVGQQLRQLVAEDRDAARLEPDDRRAAPDLVAQGVEDPLEVAPGEAEEAVVVQRPAAAEAAAGGSVTRKPAPSSSRRRRRRRPRARSGS